MMVLITTILLDVIILTNGYSVEGKVKKITDEVVVVQVKGGEVVLDKSMVKKIIKKPYVIEEEPPIKPTQEEKPTKGKETAETKKKTEQEKKKGELKRERIKKEKPLTQEEIEYLRRLVGLLGSRRASQRRRARYELSRFGARATPVLLEALHDVSFWRRMNIASLLGEFGCPETARSLLPLLSDPVQSVRAAAHSALIRITKTYVTYDPANPSPDSITLWRRVVDNFLKEQEQRKSEHQKEIHKKSPATKSREGNQLPPWERPPKQSSEDEDEGKKKHGKVVIEP